jgi:hypothetical protein
MTDLAELKARLLEDPQTRAHYDAQAPEFALARELIAARTRAGLSQTKVPEGKTGTDHDFYERGEATRPKTWSESKPGPRRRLGRCWCSLFAAWFPGGAAISLPCDGSAPGSEQ